MSIMHFSSVIAAASGAPGTVTLPGGTASHSAPQGNTATAQVSFGRDGVVTLVDGTDHDWHVSPSATVGDDYEVRATLASGTAPSSGPTLGSWHTLNTWRTWSWIRTALGTTSGTLEVEIRKITETSDNDTGNYTGSATVFPID